MSSIRDSITEGSRVMYARAWLRSCFYFSGPIPFMIGTVDRIETYKGVPPIAYVLWDGMEAPKGVLVKNLWPADKRHLEPQ